MNIAVLFGISAPAGLVAAVAGAMVLRGAPPAARDDKRSIEAPATIVFANDDEPAPKMDETVALATISHVDAVPRRSWFAPIAALFRRRLMPVSAPAVDEVDESGVVSEPVPYSRHSDEETELVAAAQLQDDGFYEIVDETRDPNLAHLQMVAQIDAERYERERALELERRDSLAVAAEAEARAQAWTQLWWVRLDPDLEVNDVRTRRAMASSLGRAGAPWAIKLARQAYTQESDASVRARLLGALVRLSATDDWSIFRSAESSGDPIEQAALRELFGDARPWFTASSIS